MLSPTPKWKFFSTSKDLLKTETGLSLSAILYMITRVRLKYFVNNVAYQSKGCEFNFTLLRNFLWWIWKFLALFSVSTLTLFQVLHCFNLLIISFKANDSSASMLTVSFARRKLVLNRLNWKRNMKELH